MKTQHWSTPYVDRLRELLPVDLGAAPLYIVDRDDVGPDFVPGRPEVLAYFCAWNDLKMEPELRRLGLWQGRGCAIFINRPTEWRMRQPANAFVGLLLHEVCHYLEIADSDACRSESIAPAAIAQARQEDLLPPLGGGALNLPMWHQHELRFLRAAIHVMARTGFSAGQMRVAGYPYGLSHGDRYARQLAMEVAERSGKRIAEILNEPAPAGVVTLWLRDVAGWQPQEVPRVYRELVRSRGSRVHDHEFAGEISRAIEEEIGNELDLSIAADSELSDPEADERFGREYDELTAQFIEVGIDRENFIRSRRITERTQSPRSAATV